MEHIVMGFGAILALIGIALFAYKGAEGSNTIKISGFEFQLAGSALVIFVMGVFIFLVPIFHADKFGALQGGWNAEPYQPQPEISPIVFEPVLVPSDTGGAGRLLAVDIRALVAEQLGVDQDNLDLSTALQSQTTAVDDLDFVEIVMKVEETYGITISDDEVDMASTSINDFADIVRDKISAP